MTFDNKGRLFVSSDASGEIYVLVADAVASAENSLDHAVNITTLGLDRGDCARTV